MTPEEIKERLAGYRPELYSDDDPIVAEALRAAKGDPDLSAWLEAEIAFDRSVSSELQNVAPPGGARDALLAAVAADGGPPTTGPRTRGQGHDRSRSRFGSKRRRTLFALGAAAAVALLAAVKVFLFPPPVEFPVADYNSVETFRDHMAYFATERFVLDERTGLLDEASEWLRARGYPAFDGIPPQIAGRNAMGCKTIDWGDNRVGLICFVDGTGDIVHLFVIEAGAIEGPSPGAPPLGEIAVRHGLETGGWQEGGRVYLLVGSEPGVEVGHLL